MEIGSGKGYPSSSLSNFAPHRFALDGVECASMEGFLQSLKFKDPQMQRHICSLVGRAAKSRGRGKNWQRYQTLYWLGRQIARSSAEYQELLDRAYQALAENPGFQKALLATGTATLKHSVGWTNPRETILTRTEFTSRLTKIRSQLQKARKS